MTGIPVELCRAGEHIGRICNIVRTGSEPQISKQIPDHCRVEDETSVQYIEQTEVGVFGLSEAISHCRSQLDFIEGTPGCLKQQRLKKTYEELLQRLLEKQKYSS